MKFEIESNGKSNPNISIQYLKISKSDRIKNAIYTFLKFAMTAILSVFIPVLHFFLVPVFSILAIYLPIRKLKQEIQLSLNEVSCPNCQSKLENEYVMFNTNEFSKKLSCPNCRQDIYISIVI